MAEVTVLVGAQWGDEGKGKWIDILAEKANLVVRYQGGNNAGHTIYVQGVKHVLHQIPSGIFQPGLKVAMAAGVVIHPSALANEIEKLTTQVTITPAQLWISARAHVITPWHVYLDGQRESSAAQPIGTTKRGIGPTYAQKASRTGLRMGQYVDAKARQKWIKEHEQEDPQFKTFRQASPEVWQEFEQAASRLLPFVCDAESRLRQEIRAGATVLLEGAQGTLLDLDHGTYPFVTSSSTISAGACTSLGLPPKALTRIIGVAKAYATRVGEGPMPTELKDKAGEHLATLGKEFGATTGRPRRCGWLDGVALRYAIAVNGCDGIILNKLDILSGLPEIKFATAYEHPVHGTLHEFPWDASILAECKPVYRTFAGWQEEIPRHGSLADLPRAAQQYIAAVQEYLGTPIFMIGSGPGRDEFISP